MRSALTRLFVLLALALPASAAPAPADLARWQKHAANVTIIRDTWGIPHVFGQTDADTVFGLLYAQAEDDFNRVELNYVNALGRLAEIEGEKELYRDLRMKLFIDPVELRAKYAASPAWLRALMDAFADGLNFYLHTHPAVRPKLITHFEPWIALSFTEGSIGGDIESVSLKNLEAFYGKAPALTLAAPDRTSPPEAQGSNGFAIAPAKSASGHALLLINPHTSFYFRPELHAVSAEGLNAYGAATWGQFFIYQGFNDRLGWMHTSNGADVIDEYLETVVTTPAGPAYRYGTETRPFIAKKIVLPYRSGPPGSPLAERIVTAYFSHHGPIIRAENGRWVAVKMMNDPVPALTQSYQRTKARTYAEFTRVMDIRTNTSNNTVYADADGNIAYFHGNFAPRRDPKFNWKLPVDGSDPATEWQGLHPVSETIHLFNPANGWLQNTNNWPFSAAGPASPRVTDYPAYLWSNPENARGLNAVRVLTDKTGFTLDSLITAASATRPHRRPPLPHRPRRRQSHHRRLRQLPARVRETPAFALRLVRRASRQRSSPHRARRAHRRPPRLGPPRHRRLRSRLPCDSLGPVLRPRHQRGQGARARRRRSHGRPAHCAAAPRRPHPSPRPPHPRLRHVANALGRDQPLPTRLR